MTKRQTGSTATFNVASAVVELERIAGSIPGFEAADSKIWRKIVRKSSYPNEYIEAAADIVDASEELRAASHFDAAAARNDITRSNEIRALIKAGESFLDGLRFTDAKLRASLVDECNQVYALAPGVARRDPSLTPHIQAMHHASRRKGGRKRSFGKD